MQIVHNTHKFQKEAARTSRVKFKMHMNLTTLSNVSCIEPTLKAPTAVYEKKPWVQLPNNAVLSFKANTPGIFFTAQGATVSNSPKEYKFNYVAIEMTASTCTIYLENAVLCVQSNQLVNESGGSPQEPSR